MEKRMQRLDSQLQKYETEINERTKQVVHLSLAVKTTHHLPYCTDWNNLCVRTSSESDNPVPLTLSSIALCYLIFCLSSVLSHSYISHYSLSQSLYSPSFTVFMPSLRVYNVSLSLSMSIFSMSALNLTVYTLTQSHNVCTLTWSHNLDCHSVSQSTLSLSLTVYTLT